VVSGAALGEDEAMSFRLPRRRLLPALPWAPAANDEEVRSYVRDRLALFSKLMFWIFWILVGFVLGLYEIYPVARPERAATAHTAAIVGLLVLAAIWQLTLVRRQVTLDTLYGIDLFYALTIGTAFGFAAYLQSDKRVAVYTAFIWHTFMVFTRAIMIPSSGRRTAVVSGISYVPLLAAAIGMAVVNPERTDVPPVAWVIGVAMFATIACLLAVFGSRVIYGLRRQISLARTLGQYTLDEKIGEGGMGTVYRARHALLRRPTAIKLVPPDKYGAENLARLEREVQHMSQLTHPNTVAIYDYGRSPDGVFYYAMEYLDGVDLEQLVRIDGPQPPGRVVHVLRQICGALDEAHGRGLAHRDIKPANVILCRRGNQPDVAKVLDFGLAQQIATADDRAGGRLLGTPAYLAPELVTSPDQVGPAADLYALGAVAYYLLTGQRVFTGKNAVELCLQHVSAPPPPPSSRTDQPIPAALEAVVMECLAKDPAARPPSAAALRARLGELPVPAWDEDAGLAWWRRFEERRRTTVTSDTVTATQPLLITVDLDARR
jgi:serine/threonine-protein kinase